MGRISLSTIGVPSDVEGVARHLQAVLNDLQDQLNIRPALYSAFGDTQPQAQTGDVLFATSGNTVSHIKVKTGKDTFAEVDQNTIGVTLESLGVAPAAITQIQAGEITQSSLGITLLTLGVNAAAATQIQTGAITQTSLGISAGAQAQINAGAIVLTGGGANSLGVTSGVAAQLITLTTISAATLGITLTSLGVIAGFLNQITTGGITAGVPTAVVPTAVVAQIETGNSVLRFRGFASGGTLGSHLTADGDWGFFNKTGAGAGMYNCINQSGTIRSILMP